MSTRGIGAALGVAPQTVANDLSNFGHLPEQITALDGKTYQATRPEPEPLTAQEQREHERLLASMARSVDIEQRPCTDWSGNEGIARV